MLNTIAAYLDLFARAIIVSRHLAATPEVLDDVRRLSIVTFLGETALAAPTADTPEDTFALPRAA